MVDGRLDAGDKAGEVVDHGAEVLAEKVARGLGIGEVDPEESCAKACHHAPQAVGRELVHRVVGLAVVVGRGYDADFANLELIADEQDGGHDGDHDGSEKGRVLDDEVDAAEEVDIEDCDDGRCLLIADVPDQH